MDAREKLSESTRPARGNRRLGLHALLLAVLVLEGLAALLLHQGRAALEDRFANGSEAAQVKALFVLTNRDDPMPLSAQEVEALVQSKNPLLREWTRTTNFGRFAASPPEASRPEDSASGASRFRCRFFDRYRLVHYNSITLCDLQKYLASLKAEDDAP